MQYGYCVRMGSKCSKVYASQSELFVAISKFVGDELGKVNMAGINIQVLRAPMPSK